MTRDEVMAMTDKELRATAWELIGGCWGEDAPDYPNDIAAAWELINKLHKQYEVAVFSDYTLLVPITDEFWRCSVSIDQMLIAEAKDADSAPRAITRAFILTMEANDD